VQRGLGAAPLDAAAVIRMARHEDPAAAAVWEEAVEALRTLAWNLTVLFDPEVVVLGGGVVRGAPELLEEIRSHVEEQAWSGYPPPEIVLGHPDAAVLGAARTAWLEYHGG